MFIDQLTAAVQAAGFPHLANIERQVWTAWSAGHLTDDQAQALAERLHAKRGPLPQHLATSNSAPTGFLRARLRLRQRSPDRILSIERRRRLAASGPMPPTMADKFTTGELAVLRIVADEVHKHGVCSAYLDELAARAGVCRTTAQNAIRSARAHRLITIEERRRRGQASLTNIIKIISPEWRIWLRLGRTGFKKFSTTDTKNKKDGLSRKGAGQNFGDTANRMPRIDSGKAADAIFRASG